MIAVKLYKWISISTISHLSGNIVSKIFCLFILLHIIDTVSYLPSSCFSLVCCFGCGDS